MKKISGRLEMLGNSIADSHFKTYSVLEIGDHLLNNVRVSSALDNFLQRGLGTTIDIWLSGKVLWGVSLEDGKSYVQKTKTSLWLVLILLGIGLATLQIGIGILFLLLAYLAYRPLSREKALRKALPNATEVRL